MNANGTFSLYSGPFNSSTLLGNSSYALGSGLYYYLELKVTIRDTTGSFEVRVDGVNRLSGANVDTKASANVIAFGANVSGSSGGHQDFYVDDLYVCDG